MQVLRGSTQGLRKTELCTYDSRHPQRCALCRHVCVIDVWMRVLATGALRGQSLDARCMFCELLLGCTGLF